MIIQANRYDSEHTNSSTSVTYTHIISKPIYWVFDGAAWVMSHVMGKVSEEDHRAELARLSQRVKANEDRAAFPNIVDRLLDAVVGPAETLLRTNDSGTPKSHSQDRVA
ncbi:MAG: hypothetical protein AABX17_04370 [Nanoarchaeota archaeon]